MADIEKGAEDGRRRHLKHNLELKAQKHIRIHGGFQWDLFREKDTGEERQDLYKPKAA